MESMSNICNGIITNYFVNNRRQNIGKSRLHFYLICLFLWTAHRFSPIEPNRVCFSRNTMEFQLVPLSFDFIKSIRFCKSANFAVNTFLILGDNK